MVQPNSDIKHNGTFEGIQTKGDSVVPISSIYKLVELWKGKNNTSGVTGVFWCKRKKRYKPSIRCDGKLLNLGSFIKSDKDKAIAVRIAAETDPRFKDQEFRHSHNDKHAPSPEMLVWAKQYLEDRIERFCWDI